MFCPKCRSKLSTPSRGSDVTSERLYCLKCDVFYGSPLYLKDVPIKEIGHLNDGENVFFAKTDDTVFIMRQPDAVDCEGIREAMKFASEYTYLRYPSPVWGHPQGICNMSRFKRGDFGAVYFIMKVDERIVGFCHHAYWKLDKETREWSKLPVPVGTNIVITQSAVFDPYQGQGVEHLCAEVNEYIARHNRVAFIMEEVVKEVGMVDIPLREGWSIYSKRVASYGVTRVLTGKPLEYPKSYIINR